MATSNSSLVRPLLALVRSAAAGGSPNDTIALKVIAQKLVTSRQSQTLLSLAAANADDGLLVTELHEVIQQLPTDKAHELGYRIQFACDELRDTSDPIAGAWE
jgi:hypothetical protein